MAGGRNSRRACGFCTISCPRVRGRAFTSGCKSSCMRKNLTVPRKAVCSLLRRKIRPQVHPAGPLFPQVFDRLFRGHRHCAQHLLVQLAISCPCGRFPDLHETIPCPTTPPRAASGCACRWSCTTRCLSFCSAFWKKPVCFMANIWGLMPRPWRRMRA